MNAECLINLSQAVAHGSLRRIKNYKTDQQGIVVNVVGDGLTVDLGPDTEVWHFQDCEEIRLQ